MKRTNKIILSLIIGLLLIAAIAVLRVAKFEAHGLITVPMENAQLA